MSTIACARPSAAPPARLATGGMPEPLGLGTFELTASGSGGFALDLSSNAGAAFESRAAAGLAPWLDVDLGFGYGAAQADAGSVLEEVESSVEAAMGSLLLRGYPVRGRWVIGVGAGAGRGCGAILEGRGECDAQHFATTGIFELDLGFRPSSRTALFLANRYQPSHAEGVPFTHWITHAFGIQVDFPEAHDLFFTAELGAAWFTHRLDTKVMGGASLGVGIRFGSR